MIKVKMNVGIAKIELEGSSKEVEKILSTYWEPHVNSWKTAEPDTPASQVRPNSPGTKKKPSSKPKGPASTVSVGSEDDQKYEEATANKIKASKDFANIKSKFIVGNSSLVEKCKLVIHFTDMPLSSGNVLRILTRLGVKTGAAQVSKALSNNKDQFITAGSNPVLYSFSASTEEAFIASLKKPDDKN